MDSSRCLFLLGVESPVAIATRVDCRLAAFAGALENDVSQRCLSSSHLASSDFRVAGILVAEDLDSSRCRFLLRPESCHSLSPLESKSTHCRPLLSAKSCDSPSPLESTVDPLPSLAFLISRSHNVACPFGVPLSRRRGLVVEGLDSSRCLFLLGAQSPQPPSPLESTVDPRPSLSGGSASPSR